MSTKAKPKRRGHVQQYSTGGGIGGQEQPSSGARALPSILAPPLATIPSGNPTSPNSLPSEHTQADDRDPKDPSGDAWSQNAESDDVSRVHNASSLTAYLEPQNEPQIDGQRDPWDEEIGDISWEDDGAQETSQGHTAATETAVSAPLDLPYANTLGPEPIESREPAKKAISNLADLLWDDGFGEGHAQWPLGAHSQDVFESGHAPYPTEESNSHWEQPLRGLIFDGAQKRHVSRENSLDHLDNEQPAPKQAGNEDIDPQESLQETAWESHHMLEKPSELSWEESASTTRRHEPEVDFWADQEPVEKSIDFIEETASRYSLKSHVTDNYQPLFLQSGEHETEQFARHEGTWTETLDPEQTADSFFENSQPQNTETAPYVEQVEDFGLQGAEYPWPHENSASHHSHRSFLDEEEPQTLNFQESDHPQATTEQAVAQNWRESDNDASRGHTPIDHEDIPEAQQQIQPGDSGIVALFTAVENLAAEMSLWPKQDEGNQKYEHDYTECTPEQAEEVPKPQPTEPAEPDAVLQTPWPLMVQESPPALEEQNHDANHQAPGEEHGHGRGLDAPFGDSNVTPFELSLTTPAAESVPDEKRTKALELLDMDDDLLLDDDFLDDEPELLPPPLAAAESKPEKSSKSTFASKYSKPADATRSATQYAPSTAAQNSSYAPPPSNNFFSNAAPEKDVVMMQTKKNDAYDFPSEFSKLKVKPASRAILSSVIPRVSPSNMAPNGPVNTGSVPVAPGIGAATSNKPFFEDLPVALPKPANKPKRAALAPASTGREILQPSLLLQEPASSLPKKSPQNPYATLAPKVGLAAQHPQTMGIDRAGGASKYQPAISSVPRTSQQNMSVPMRSGVVPPPGMKFQSDGGAHAMNNAHNAASQYAPAPYPGNQASQGSIPETQYEQGRTLGNHYSQGTMAESEYPHQVSDGQVPQAPTRSQYAPASLQNQFAPPGLPGPHPGPQTASQYAHAPFSQQQQMHEPPANGNFVPLSANVLAQEPHAPAARAPRINTSMTKSNEKNTSVSPYVPNTGPYGPPARTHSRTSSIIGGNAKVGNPYAPAKQGGMNMSASPIHTSAPVNPVVRKRAKSSVRPGVMGQLPEKIENPEALLRRQFPIFNWGPSDQAVLFISQPGNGFEMPQRVIRVGKVSELAPHVEVHADFPGPLSRSKSKRKDLEVWLEKNIAKLKADHAKTDELLINELLYALVQNDGEFTSEALHKKWASILTPNVDFSFTQDPNLGFSSRAGPGISANAFKLDNAGISTVWALVQAGNRKDALQFAISKQDWAFAFIIAQSLGPEAFSKVCSDYARISFPFLTNQNTRVQHLMPLLLKIFVGNVKSVIDDFVNVPSEAEFAKSHYREIISAAIINGSRTEFLVEFGNFLSKSGLACASETCFMLAGLMLSRVPLQSGATFSILGSFTLSSVYSEAYEYVLSMSSTTSGSIPSTGLPDLLLVKIRRAQILADAGHFTASRKYCDHIGGVLRSLGKSPFVTPSTSADFKHLLVRLSDCSASESGWLGGKLSKVNLDKVWGSLDKFIGGEDPSTKPAEKGVFSNFTPTISRKSSMLEMSSQRNDSFAAPSHLLNAPPKELMSPSHTQRRPVAPQKYVPGIPAQSLNAPHPPLGKPPATMGGKLSMGATSAGRYHTQNGSLSSVNFLDSKKPERLQGSHSAGHQHPVNPRHQIYANHTAHLSSLSIVSQSASVYGSGAGPTSSARPVISDARHSEYDQDQTALPKSSNGHSRTSSHQSETNDYSRSPLRVLPERKLSIPEEVADMSSEEEKQLGNVDIPEQHADFASTEVQEEQKDTKQNVSNEQQNINFLEKDEESVLNEEQAEIVRHQITSETQEIAHIAQSPPAAVAPALQVPAKVNPYAPGGARRSKGSNRYGPGAAAGSSNKYNFEPESNAVRLAGASSDTPFAEVLDSDKKEQSNEAEEDPTNIGLCQTDSEMTKDIEMTKNTEITKDSEMTKAPTSNLRNDTNAPQTPSSDFSRVARPIPARRADVLNGRQKRNPYAPPTEAVETNVDISFDPEMQEDVVHQIEEQLSGLILNEAVASPTTYKPGYMNPYQERKKLHADLPIQSGFDEFPIPRTPEYTTRANSVVGHTGLYSSRLSQSQQSALYQQYEVKDDTVLDYIPVPEENEEDDSESKSLSSEIRKKSMEDAKHKIQEEMSRRGGGENAESGWFKGWLGNKKNDDKPKPIRAKLGKANTFKYDEKHKRWIDSSRPLEEQLKEAAPPPPPKKKQQSDKPQGEAPAIAAPAPMRGPSAAPNSVGGRRPSVTKPSVKAAAEPAAPRPNLANAGLDDLLSLGSSGGGPASSSGRRGKRRYVNVMETK